MGATRVRLGLGFGLTSRLGLGVRSAMVRIKISQGWGLVIGLVMVGVQLRD